MSCELDTVSVLWYNACNILFFLTGTKGRRHPSGVCVLLCLGALTQPVQRATIGLGYHPIDLT